MEIFTSIETIVQGMYLIRQSAVFYQALSSVDGGSLEIPNPLQYILLLAAFLIFKGIDRLYKAVFLIIE